MSPVSPLTSEAPSAEERWRRWQQRGVVQDALLMRRAKIVFGTLLLLAVAGAAGLWLQ